MLTALIIVLVLMLGQTEAGAHNTFGLESGIGSQHVEHALESETGPDEQD